MIKVDTSIVRLNVGVVDRTGTTDHEFEQGKFYRLRRRRKTGDFAFRADGRRRFSVVMILDMSGSTLGFRQTIQQSAFRFIDALSPDDRVAVVEFYDKVNLRNDFTTDRKTIANSIAVANGRGKTQLYKALDFALEKLSKEGKRRKAIIVLTDGVDTAVRDKDREFLCETSRRTEMPTAIKPETSEILNRVLNNVRRAGRDDLSARAADRRPVQSSPTRRRFRWRCIKAARARLQILADRTGGTLQRDQPARRNGQTLRRGRRRHAHALHDRIPARQRQTRRQMARDKNRSDQPRTDFANTRKAISPSDDLS